MKCFKQYKYYLTSTGRLYKTIDNYSVWWIWGQNNLPNWSIVNIGKKPGWINGLENRAKEITEEVAFLEIL